MYLLIKNTTREERQKIVEDAIALSSLDSRPPTDDAMKLYQKYIDGEMELDEVTNHIIASYTQNDA